MKHLSNLTLVLILLILLSCNKDDLASSVISDIRIEFRGLDNSKLTTDTLKADLSTRIKVVAVLSGDVSSENRSITFKTEKGNFDTNDEADKSTVTKTAVEIRDSARFEAEAILTMGSVPESFLISVQVDNAPTFMDDTLVFLAPVNDIIEFMIFTDTSSLFATGITEVRFSAKIDNTITAGVGLQLETTTGTFLGSFEDPTSIEVPLKSDRSIEPVVLRVGKTPGDHYITASLVTSNSDQQSFSEEFKLTLDTLYAEDIIDLSIARSNGLRANSVDTTLVTVQLRNTDQTSVSLETNGGTFISPSNGSTITLDMDQNGVGTAVFQSGANSGPYNITASLQDGSGFDVSKTVTLSTINTSDVITSLISDEPSGTIRADGSTEIRFVAAVDQENTSESNVNFSVSDGATFADNGTQVLESPIINGEAEARLKVGVEGRIIYVTASVGTNPSYSIREEYVINPPNASDFFEITLTNSMGLIADGESEFFVQPMIKNSELVSSVTVSLSDGNFKNGGGKSKALGNQEIGTVVVEQSPKTYLVQASAGSSLPDTVILIDVAQSLPDFLTLDPTSFLIDSLDTDGISITVQLGKTNGSNASDETLIEFEATQQGDGRSIGRFSPLIVRSNANGEATVQFFTDVQSPDKGATIDIRAYVSGTSADETVGIVVRDN